jgi:hypothetical protein
MSKILAKVKVKRQLYTDVNIYRCKFLRKKGYSCQARLRIVRPTNSNIIRVEEGDIQHTHEPIAELTGSMKLSARTKSIINQQHEQQKMPQQIRNHLQDVLYLYTNKICIFLSYIGLSRKFGTSALSEANSEFCEPDGTTQYAAYARGIHQFNSCAISIKC